MKCSYCNKEAMYSVGWMTDKFYENYACDEHLEMARLKQEYALVEEKFREKLNLLREKSF